MKRRVLTLAMSMVLAIGLFPMQAMAAAPRVLVIRHWDGSKAGTPGSEQSNPNLRGTGLREIDFKIGKNEKGVYLYMYTATYQTAEKIGMKDISLYQRTFLGWQEVVGTAGDYMYDTDSYIAEALYEGTQQGKEYRGVATHVAVVDGIEYTCGDATTNIKY